MVNYPFIHHVMYVSPTCVSAKLKIPNSIDYIQGYESALILIATDNVHWKCLSVFTSG